MHDEHRATGDHEESIISTNSKQDDGSVQVGRNGQPAIGV
jgi:hypothetical protein